MVSAHAEEMDTGTAQLAQTSGGAHLTKGRGKEVTHPLWLGCPVKSQLYPLEPWTLGKPLSWPVPQFPLPSKRQKSPACAQSRRRDYEGPWWESLQPQGTLGSSGCTFVPDSPGGGYLGASYPT